MPEELKDEKKDETPKSVPETPEGAKAMLQSAVKQCIAAGLLVKAQNSAEHGLVIAVREFALDGERFILREKAVTA